MTNEAAERLREWIRESALLWQLPKNEKALAMREFDAALADERRASHPRTYSLTASGPNGELFLVTDDESGINIGHAAKIGGPLTAPCRAILDAEADR